MSEKIYADRKYVESLIAAGGGGVTSWNDLTDRPFYEEDDQTVIEWDSSTEGRDSFGLNDLTYYKVSDLIPTVEELMGGNISVVSNGSHISGALDDTTLISAEGYISLGEVAYVVVQTPFNYNDAIIGAPSTGIYIVYIDDPSDYVLTYGPIIHKLDPKFLPEGSAGWEEGEQTIIEWDGNTEGRDSVSPVDGMTLIKVSDELPDPTDLLGSTVWLSDGSSMIITEDNVNTVTDMYVIYNGGTSILFGVQSLSVEGIEFPSTHLWEMFNLQNLDLEKSLSIISMRSLSLIILPELRIFQNIRITRLYIPNIWAISHMKQ